MWKRVVEVLGSFSLFALTHAEAAQRLRCGVLSACLAQVEEPPARSKAGEERTQQGRSRVLQGAMSESHFMCDSCRCSRCHYSTSVSSTRSHAEVRSSRQKDKCHHDSACNSGEVLRTATLSTLRKILPACDRRETCEGYQHYCTITHLHTVSLLSAICFRGFCFSLREVALAIRGSTTA